MMSKSPQDSVLERQRLRQEIERLNRLQAKGLNHAIYGGMNPAEATEYDERRTQITRLVKELEALTKNL